MCIVSDTVERKEKGNGWEASDKLKDTPDLLARFSLLAHTCTIV